MKRVITFLLLMILPILASANQGWVTQTDNKCVIYYRDGVTLTVIGISNGVPIFVSLAETSSERMSVELDGKTFIFAQGFSPNAMSSYAATGDQTEVVDAMRRADEIVARYALYSSGVTWNKYPTKGKSEAFKVYDRCMKSR